MVIVGRHAGLLGVYNQLLHDSPNQQGNHLLITAWTIHKLDKDSPGRKFCRLLASQQAPWPTGFYWVAGSSVATAHKNHT